MVSVISEIGVNWDGDFDVVREMITKSKNVGCDAVKFQSFDEKNLGNHPKKSKTILPVCLHLIQEQSERSESCINTI